MAFPAFLPKGIVPVAFNQSSREVPTGVSGDLKDVIRN
jgi:hypothetical protein